MLTHVVDLATVAHELYALPLEEFTGTRNERAKDAKSEGDKALADSIKNLAKPSLAAWVVNMLIRHQADEVEQVLTLGAALRQAQADLDGAELRQLNKQRRLLISAVTRQGRALARELGQRIGDAVATQVEETLHAAMVDETAASAVRSGLLTRAVSSTGLGPVDLDGVVAVLSELGKSAPRAAPKERPKLSVVPDNSRAVDDAKREVEQSEATAAVAKKEQTKAEQRVGALEARSMELQGHLEELRRSLSEKENELEAVEDDLGSAEEERDEAAEMHAEARRAVDEAKAKLAKLED